MAECGVVCELVCFFFQAEDGIRDYKVTGVQTCALPISVRQGSTGAGAGTGTEVMAWSAGVQPWPSSEVRMAGAEVCGDSQMPATIIRSDCRGLDRKSVV